MNTVHYLMQCDESDFVEQRNIIMNKRTIRQALYSSIPVLAGYVV